MLPFRLIYHDQYDLKLRDHVFPSQKYKLIRDRLLEEHIAEPADFVSPEQASDDDMRLVHDDGWIHRLRTGTLHYMEVLKLEIPYSSPTVEAFWWATGGTTTAARLALRDRVGFNIGGGFHHAFPGHGEGFCAVNDIAVAVRRLQRDQLVTRAMVVDCDVHQGNGTAAIFAGDPAVFTLSIHQLNNYPDQKPPSNVDIHLEDGAGDADYLDKLEASLVPALETFRPELVMYVAGADPFYQDQLGGLNLSLHGLERRDRLVMESALRHGAAVAVVLAGGYSYDVRDTVSIHVATARIARDLLA
jgi:acetoin utilization deacetylase AcuC-like enzyme